MELFHWLVEQFVGFMSIVGLDKDVLKAAFADYGLEPLWAVLRDTYLNPYYMLFVFPLWLALGHFWPVEKPTRKTRANVLMDFLYPLFILPIQMLVVTSLIVALRSWFEASLPFMNTRLLDGESVIVQAMGYFLITDFMFYVAHVVKHKVPWLWYFHTVHHSQTHVNLFTTHRNHPIEAITDFAIKAVPIAIIGGSYPALTLYLLVHNMWGYFIHANLRTNMGFLKYFLVTPQNHRMHHTIIVEQADRNFGERLTIWDWMFGTLYKDFNAYPPTGVKGTEWIVEQGASPSQLIRGWAYQMIYPFQRIGMDIRNFVLRHSKRFA